MWRRLNKQTLVLHTAVNKRYHHNKNYLWLEMEHAGEGLVDEAGTSKAGVHRTASNRSARSSNSTSTVSSINSERRNVAIVEDPYDVARDNSQREPPPKQKKDYFRVNPHEDRDPKHIAAAVKIAFEDIIGEPDRNQYSFDEAWNASQIAYACSRLWCYRIMTLLCGVPISCCWGMLFACLSGCASWIWAPQLKAFQLVMAYGRLFVEGIVNCLVEPCCYAYGVYWSRVRIVHTGATKAEQCII